MNKHELHGNARHLGGNVEKAIGDMVDSRDWKVAGVTDQVAGSAEHLFGRAQSIAGEVADATPSLIEEARERIGDVADRSVAAARRGSGKAVEAVRAHNGNNGVVWAVVAALGGYALAALVHGRRN
ncbi:MAG TPA: CsbD family protein [Sphingomonas sanguinis]|uniref:CsbD family protein n=1 Tax=Sphingomonas sanguinis TaxID=33051 RepID=UPI002AC13C6C|nr:CsbD family protein [Sphingomonas sanguinis]